MIESIIEIFFTTTVWIIGYLSILDFLNFRFPPVVTEHFFQTPRAYPKPFDIPLYLLTTALFVLFIFMWHRYIDPRLKLIHKIPINHKLKVGIKGLLLLLLIILFATKLGPYPWPHDIHPYPIRQNTVIYNVFFLGLTTVSIFFIVELYILEALLKKKPHLHFLIYIPVILYIALITFEPRFPLTGADFAHFLGPAWEVAHGKTIYTQIPSQYTLIPILILAFFLKINIPLIIYLKAIVWLFFIFEYTLCFKLIRDFTRSGVVASLGLVTIATLNFLSVGQAVQESTLRFGPLIIGIFIYYKVRDISSKWLIFTVAFFSFWFIDTGIYMQLAYIASLIFFILTKEISVKKALSSVIYLIAATFGVFIIINLVSISLGGEIINFFALFHTIKKYSSQGFDLIPIDAKNYFWFFMLFYFAAIISFLRKKEITYKDRLLILTANISFFTSMLFVGRSHPLGLSIITVFPVLLLFFFCGDIYQLLNNRRIKFIFLSTIFILFIAIPFGMRKEFISETLLERFEKLQQGNIFYPELHETIQKLYGEEIKFIKKNLSGDEVIVLSRDDTYLLYMANKKNLLDTNPIFSIESKPEIEPAIKRAIKVCPKLIAIDCSVFKKCQSYEPFSGGFPNLQYILKELENSCHNKYQPTVCTNKLCIAQS